MTAEEQEETLHDVMCGAIEEGDVADLDEIYQKSKDQISSEMMENAFKVAVECDQRRIIEWFLSIDGDHVDSSSPSKIAWKPAYAELAMECGNHTLFCWFKEKGFWYDTEDCLNAIIKFLNIY